MVQEALVIGDGAFCLIESTRTIAQPRLPSANKWARQQGSASDPRRVSDGTLLNYTMSIEDPATVTAPMNIVTPRRFVIPEVTIPVLTRAGSL